HLGVDPPQHRDAQHQHHPDAEAHEESAHPCHGTALLSLVAHSAASPRSPVRMRTTSSSEVTNTLPSPNLPVPAVLSTASTACSTSSSGMATSILILGRNSTLYSLPR